MVLPVVVFVSPHSWQMDSGYNTQNCGSNIMDTAGAESYCVCRKMHKPWSRDLNLEFLIQRYGKNIEQVWNGCSILLNVTIVSLFLFPFCLKLHYHLYASSCLHLTAGESASDHFISPNSSAMREHKSLGLAGWGS